MSAFPVPGRTTLSLLAAGMLACSATDNTLPSNVTDPANVRTPSGALAFYRGVVDTLSVVFKHAVVDASAIMSDEVMATSAPLFTVTPDLANNSRTNPSAEQLYNRLHQLRAQASEARGYLAIYAPDSPPALRGHLYAVQGYAELVLADQFCSGIPLSTVDFGADYTLAAGSTTAEVYAHARALFDTALTLVGDSLRFQHLAEVGRARALVGLDSLAAAAATVTGVPPTFVYQTTFVGPGFVGGGGETWLWREGSNPIAFGALTVGDIEGINGLDYRSSGDPRTKADSFAVDSLGHTVYNADRSKYPVDGSAITLVLANGIEARLIEAEAALAAGNGGWLATLNALRTDGTQDGGGGYNPGTGGVAGLAPLADPGTPAARVDLVFRERAFWLYLTGHRLADLRRLVRQYGRSVGAVFPTGVYLGGTGAYGPAVTVPVPASEQTNNPHYHGCIDQNA